LLTLKLADEMTSIMKHLFIHVEET
jgi:hypothetical protein